MKIINAQSITLDQIAVHQTRFLSEHKETPETLRYRRSLYGEHSEQENGKNKKEAM